MLLAADLNRANGISEIEGKATRVGASERSRGDASDIDGQTQRSNGAFGKSDIEGKVARVAARKRGRDRVSSEREHRVKTFEVRSSDFKYDSLFLSRIVSGLRCMSRTTVAAGVSPANGANGMSDIEGKAAREAASECGQGASFKNLQQCRYATLHLQKTVSASAASEPR